jgi:hypothetical protein
MTHPMGFLSNNKDKSCTISNSSNDSISKISIRKILSTPPTSRAAAKRAKMTAEYSLREY